MTEDYKKEEGADFDIGILHGNSEGASEHDNYAPFQVKDLVEKKFDYWAFGHIHKRTIVIMNRHHFYPGNIQGRNKKEQGVKGCYLVNMNEQETKIEFIETSDVVWEEVCVDAAGLHSFQEYIYNMFTRN